MNKLILLLLFFYVSSAVAISSKDFSKILLGKTYSIFAPIIQSPEIEGTVTFKNDTSISVKCKGTSYLISANQIVSFQRLNRNCDDKNNHLDNLQEPPSSKQDAKAFLKHIREALDSNNMNKVEDLCRNYVSRFPGENCSLCDSLQTNFTNPHNYTKGYKELKQDAMDAKIAQEMQAPGNETDDNFADWFFKGEMPAKVTFSGKVTWIGDKYACLMRSSDVEFLITVNPKYHLRENFMIQGIGTPIGEITYTTVLGARRQLPCLKVIELK